MSIEHLRALALDEHAPTAEWTLCLNRDLRLRIVDLMRQIGAATRLAEKLTNGDPTSLSLTDEDPTSRAERLTGELEALYEEARPDSIVLVFRRLPATRDVAEDGETAYSTVERRHTNNKTRAVDVPAVAADLLPLCYERAESADGEDVGLTWLQVLRTLDAADLDQLGQMVFGLHHIGAAVPFDPRTSGRPETT